MKGRLRDTSIMAMVIAVVAVVLVMLASVPKTSAIPAFSRKYQTSCTTCHSNYPELNDFGEAFKKNGFKFPKDDDSFVKEPPVMLGAKAQKEAFPNAVFPGEIPGFLPVAFRYEGNFTLNRKQPRGVIEQSGFTPRTDLFAPNTFTIISAGSFGQNLSFWIDDDISVDGANANGTLGDGWLKYSDLGHGIGLPKNSLNVRFGQFELDLPFTQARSIYLSPYDIYNQTNVAGTLGTTNNPVIFGSPQRGIEFGGTPNNGNFDWSVAILNGNNSGDVARSSKDVYVRLSQRFNLERDPESRNPGSGPHGPARPHLHSFRLLLLLRQKPAEPGWKTFSWASNNRRALLPSGWRSPVQIPAPGAVRPRNVWPRRQSCRQCRADSGERTSSEVFWWLCGRQLLVLSLADRNVPLRRRELARGLCEWHARVEWSNTKPLQPRFPNVGARQHQGCG